MYPISVVLATEAAAGWLTEDGFAHMSTFGGAELGCVAALKTLEITCRPEVRSMVHYIAATFTEGLARIQAAYPDWFTGIRQDGLVMGLEFGHPQGAKFVMKRLYENGVWAIFSTLDPACCSTSPASCSPRRCARNCWNGPRWPSARPATTRRDQGGGGGDRGAAREPISVVGAAHRPGGRAAGPGHAAARRVGRARVRPVRQGLGGRDRARRRRGGRGQGPRVRRVGGAGDRVRRGRAQGAQERRLQHRDRRTTTRATTT